MAPYNYQQPPAPSAPNAYGSHGRGGFSEDRGGGNNHHAGFSNSSRGNGNSRRGRGVHNDFRKPLANGYNNYGPRAVLAMSPANWEGPNGIFKNPVVGMGASCPWRTTTIPASSPSFGHSMSPRIPSYTNTPAHSTPIATPTLPTAVPAVKPAASTAKHNTKVPSCAHMASDPDDGGTPAEAPSFIPHHSEMPKTKAVSQDCTSEARLTYTKGEGKIDAIDTPFEKPDATVELLLDAHALAHISSLGSTEKAELQQALHQANNVYHIKEAADTEERSNILSTFRAAGLKEHNLENNIQQCNANVVRKLAEGSQAEAVSYLKTAIPLSRGAREHRMMMDGCREALLGLDNQRMVNAKVYADAIHNTVVNALRNKVAIEKSNVVVEKGGDDFMGSEEPKDGSRSTKDASQGPGSPQSGSEHTQDGANESRGATQQCVFEQQPEAEHRSIDEVLDRISDIKVEVGTKALDEKTKDNAANVPKQQAQKEDVSKSKKQAEPKKNNVPSNGSKKQKQKQKAASKQEVLNHDPQTHITDSSNQKGPVKEERSQGDIKAPTAQSPSNISNATPAPSTTKTLAAQNQPIVINVANATPTPATDNQPPVSNAILNPDAAKAPNAAQNVSNAAPAPKRKSNPKKKKNASGGGGTTTLKAVNGGGAPAG
jgi:hypothetical protein